MTFRLRLWKALGGLFLAAVFFPVFGEWFIEYARESGLYANPSQRVQRAASFLVSIANFPGFKVFAGFVIGIAACRWMMTLGRVENRRGSSILQLLGGRFYESAALAAVDTEPEVIQTSGSHQLIRLAIVPSKPVSNAVISIPRDGIEKWEDASWKSLGLPGALPLYWSVPSTGNSSLSLDVLSERTVFALIDVPPMPNEPLIYSERPDGDYTQYNGEISSPGKYRLNLILFSDGKKVQEFRMIVHWYGDAHSVAFDHDQAALCG